MPEFAYKARKRSGDLVEGVISGSDRSQALAQIGRMGLYPVRVDPAGGGGSGAKATRKAPSAPVRERRQGTAGSGTATKTPIARRKDQPPRRQAKKSGPAPAAGGKAAGTSSRHRKPKLTEVATFTRQFANLLGSGMPLTAALNSMSYIGSKGIPGSLCLEIRQEITEGANLSDAMARKGGRVFSDLYINMVRAGEQSGALTQVLRRLADHYERFSEVQQKFTSAMIYPTVVVTVGVVLVLCFMKFMLPKFLTVFEGVNVELPTSTKILIGISDFVNMYWWLILGAIFLSILGFIRFKATPAGGRKVDEWSMSLPLFGNVVRLNLFGQFARTLSTLLTNGVPVLVALKITEKTISNRIIREAIAKTRDDVTDGKTLAEPLARSRIFPQLMIDLLRIGEETGDVPGALENVANTYENELSNQLKILTNLIEPVMIIVIAVLVAGLMFSVLSAMMAITRSVAS
jgi:type II secretory pathway component PulF